MERDERKFEVPTILVYGIKGGVGKSFVAANLARALYRRGYTVGLLDADVDSANLPQMMGLEHAMLQDKTTWYFIPARVDKKILVFSYALMDVGRRKIKAVMNTSDFFAQVVRDGLLATKWTGIDVMVIDCPAGSSDELISILSYIDDMMGGVIVCTPDTYEDLERALQVAEFSFINVIGVIENMSGAVTECGEVPVCPKCNKPFVPFQTKKTEEICKEHGVELSGRIPLTASLEKGWMLKDEVADSVFGKILEYIDYYIKHLSDNDPMSCDADVKEA